MRKVRYSDTRLHLCLRAFRVSTLFAFSGTQKLCTVNIHLWFGFRVRTRYNSEQYKIEHSTRFLRTKLSLSYCSWMRADRHLHTHSHTLKHTHTLLKQKCRFKECMWQLGEITCRQCAQNNIHLEKWRQTSSTVQTTQYFWKSLAWESRSFSLEVDQASTLASWWKAETNFVAPPHGTIVLSRGILLASSRTYVESAPQVSSSVFHFVYKLERPGSSIQERTVVVLLGYETIAWTIVLLRSCCWDGHLTGFSRRIQVLDKTFSQRSCSGPRAFRRLHTSGSRETCLASFRACCWVHEHTWQPGEYVDDVLWKI